MGIDWEAKVGAPTVRVFGDPALYVPRDASTPYVITGVFDESYQDVTIIEPEAHTTEGRPVIGINSLQALGHQAWDQDDRVVTGITLNLDGTYVIGAGARTWRVKEVQPDRKGHMMLTLNTAEPFTP